MNKSLIVILGLVGFAALCNTSVYAAPSAKVTARVVDETGKAIQGAYVTAGYTLGKRGGVGTDDYREKGKSDKDGLFTATGETIIPQVTIHAEFEGYYRSSKWAKFTTRSRLRNRWEPWNPTVEVVLKKKRNPVAMYIRDTGWVKMPNLNESIGYDLEKGDWVTPYGGGTTSDLVIEFNLEKQSYTNYKADMTIRFSNENDGIQEYYFDDNDQSYFKWPFNAPESGYKSSIHVFEHDTPDGGYKNNLRDNVNYLLRTRTKIDKDGNIVEAKYGKLVGEFGISRKGKTKFHYYFNPDGTRNLEENPEKNLFKKK